MKNNVGPSVFPSSPADSHRKAALWTMAVSIVTCAAIVALIVVAASYSIFLGEITEALFPVAEGDWPAGVAAMWIFLMLFEKAAVPMVVICILALATLFLNVRYIARTRPTVRKRILSGVAISISLVPLVVYAWFLTGRY